MSTQQTPCTPSTTTSPVQTPRLLRHLHALRAPLFPFLSAGDFILLRWTCPTFYEDDEVARRVLDAMNQLPKCFFLGCSTDWCADVPLFHDGGDASPDSHRDPSTGQWQYPRAHEHRSTDEVMEAIQTKLGSPERCASLLSLAWLLMSELQPLLTSTASPRSLRYKIVPFILPLARLDEIAHQHPPPGPATALGCHFENLTGQEGEDTTCALCAALQLAEQEAEEYQERRGPEEQELEERLLEEDCEDFNERMDAYYASKAATDALYGYDYEYNAGEIVKSWCADGTLPPLPLLGEVGDKEFATATCINFYGSGYYETYGYGFCKSELRPLATFFRRHGFGRVHRATIQSHQFETEQAFYKEEVASVEMVGAAAPHGFFAGVYYVAWHT